MISVAFTTRQKYNISMEKSRKFLFILLTIVAVACIVGIGYICIQQMIQNRHSREVLDSLRATVETLESLPETSEPDPSETEISQPETELPEDTVSDTAETPDAVPEAETVPLVPNPYAEVYASNEDIVGWLQIPDTKVDYPVVWTPEDEDYYLYKDIEGNEDKNGSLILDTDSSLSPPTTNLIIHGHNMRSGAMFGNLTDYENQDYYENHKQIILYTEECQRNYEVIAVFRSQVYKKSQDVFKFYKFFQADTQKEFDDFYNNIKELSLYDTGVTAEFGDRFITLSTCVYHVEQGRFVVVAKEVESGDSYLPIEN